MKYPLLVLLLLYLNIATAKGVVVDVTIESDIYNYAQEVLAGRHPLEVTNYAGKNSQRDVVDFIIVQQALALGGSELEFSFITGNYDVRNPRLLKDGLLLINFDTLWLSHAKTFANDAYISDPIIRKGEYFAGIYTSIENKDKLVINTLSDFQKLTVISNRHWPVDWQTLTELKPLSLKHEEEWLFMVKLVSLGWVDVMLSPFTKSQTFSYQRDNYQIIAVEGVKVALNDSRHFLVSKKHPLGQATFQALQKGLKILRERGTIEKAYRQAGFFNSKVKDWKVINQTLLENSK